MYINILQRCFKVLQSSTYLRLFKGSFCDFYHVHVINHSSRRADWFRHISHRRGHYCIVTSLNHRSPLNKAGVRNLILAVYFASLSAIEKFSTLFVPIYL